MATQKNDGVVPSEEAFRKLERHVAYLDSIIRNTQPPNIGPRIGGGQTVIKFSLNEELRRNQTRKAVQIPFEGNEEVIDDEEIDVVEDGQLSSDLRAPEGTTGYATNSFDEDKWLILSLDCEALLPHDGDLQTD